MDDVVDRIIRGDYCGQERKRTLGLYRYNYENVQKEINRRLGYSKRHNPLDCW